MARSYGVSPDISEKEKIIGGVLTINQFLWLVGGLIMGLAVFALMFPFMGVSSLFFAVLFTAFGLPFAFWKPRKMTLFRYIILKQTYKKKVKKLPNKRKEVKW